MARSYVVQSFRNYLIVARSPFALGFILTDFAPKNGDRLGLVDISEVILDSHSQIPKGS